MIASLPRDLRPRLKGRLRELVAADDGVPGASLGVLANGEVVSVAAGVTSLRTRIPVTPETLFQIGSITKVYTAVLVMQLVDEGLLGLDAPVQRHLPQFRVADADASRAITPRHLLTHTSGIDADLADFGRGDDCVARYVESLSSAPLLWPPGSAYSYCNPGFIVLGRLVEVLRGATWDVVIRERLFQPLGLRHTVTLPEEALLFSAAVGHMAGAEGRIEVAKEWVLPRSCGPAGLICSTAVDLLDFAQLHLRGGLAADGTKVLSETSATEMRRKHAEMSYRDSGVGQGLGWGLLDWNGEEVFAHGGGTLGQLAYLHVHPASGVAVALLTNGPSVPLFRELNAEIFAELAGVRMAAEPAPGYQGGDCSGLEGLYRNRDGTGEVRVEESNVRVAWWPAGALVRPQESALKWTALERGGEHLFLIPEPLSNANSEIMFTNLDAEGRPQRAYIAGRAANRVIE